MSIIVQSGASAVLSDRTFRKMFEDRKSVFVDLLGWDVPVLDGRFEFDEFDNERATYLIIADDEGDHLGSARLLPTTRRHILGSLFASLCAAPPPTGPQVFEITRFCLSPRHRAAGRRVVRRQLVTGLVWHALETGIRTYTGVAEMAWLQQILAFGWDCRPLGVPARFDCGMIASIAIEIGRDTPELLAATGIWDATAIAPAQVREAA